MPYKNCWKASTLIFLGSLQSYLNMKSFLIDNMDIAGKKINFWILFVVAVDLTKSPTFIGSKV